MTRPISTPQTVFAGTSVAVLTYIGFDAISTLSEEAENPRRNILLATVLVCVFAGVLSGLEVYAAQLVWGSKPFAADRVESAFAMVSQQVGGVLLFQVMNFTLLVANAGTAIASQLAAGRLLYGMGQGNAIPKSFFGVDRAEASRAAQRHRAGGRVRADRRGRNGILFRHHRRQRLCRGRPGAQFRRLHQLHGRQCRLLHPLLVARQTTGAGAIFWCRCWAL